MKNTTTAVTCKTTEKNIIVYILVLCFAAVLGGNGLAGEALHPAKPLYSYYNPFLGARSLSMGDAFTAVADDLTAVFTNPAGLAAFHIPRVLFNYRMDQLRFTQPPPNSTESPVHSLQLSSSLKTPDFMAISVPAFFWDIKWNLALSYQRHFPYAFDARLEEITPPADDETPGESVLLQQITGASGIDALGFSCAFDLADYLRFGITLRNYFGSGETTYRDLSDEPSNNLSQGVGHTYSDKLKGRNVVLGMLLDLSDQITLGAAYHTRFSGTLESLSPDGAGGNVPAKHTVTMPARFSYGVKVKASRDLQLSYDYTRIFWSDAVISDVSDVSDSSDVAPPGETLQFPVRHAYSFLQQDSVSRGWGMELGIPVKTVTLFLRGGLVSRTQIFPDAEGVPVKLKGFSLGMGLDVASQLKVDVGWARRKGNWSEAGYPFPVPGTASSYKNDIIAVSFSYSFGGRAR